MDEREFYGCRIQWNQHVLIPRQESEILVLYTLQRLEKEPAGVFVDLCTGSGCLGLAVKKARPDMHVILTDVSPLALEVARHNQKLNQLDVEILEGDFLEPLQGRSIDYLMSNPPYVTEGEYETLDPSVKAEPKIALVGGVDGLLFYRRLAEARLSVKRMFLEIGKDQGAAVLQLFSSWSGEIIKDWAGHDRFIFLDSL